MSASMEAEHGRGFLLVLCSVDDHGVSPAAHDGEIVWVTILERPQ